VRSRLYDPSLPLWDPGSVQLLRPEHRAWRGSLPDGRHVLPRQPEIERLIAWTEHRLPILHPVLYWDYSSRSRSLGCRAIWPSKVGTGSFLTCNMAASISRPRTSASIAYVRRAPSRSSACRLAALERFRKLLTLAPWESWFRWSIPDRWRHQGQSR